MDKIALIVLLLLFAALACDDSKKIPVDPVEPEETEHLFYIAPREGNMVKVLSVEQSAIIDSFIIDSVAVSDTMMLHVTGNDSLLAVSAGMKTYLYDLEQHKVVGSFEAIWPIFSRDSRYFVDLSNRHIKEFPALNTIFAEANGHSPMFGVNSECHAIIDWITPEGGVLGTGIHIYNMKGDSIFTVLSHVPGVYGYQNCTSEKHSKVVFAANGGYGDIVGITDFANDQLRVLKVFLNSYNIGSIPVIDPVQNRLFISTITSAFWGGIPDQNIYVFDLATEDSVATINVDDLEQVGNMIISYDSRYLLARPFNEFKRVYDVCLIDLENYSILATVNCGFIPGSVSSKFCSKNIGY